MKRKFSVALACAMAILMTTAAAFAAGIHFGVFDFMTDQFGQDNVLPQAQEMVAHDLAAVTLEHTTLTVEEAVYDGGNLRVVYSVASRKKSLPIEKAAEADQVSLNGCDWFCLNGEEQIMTSGSYFGSTLSPEGDRMLCYLDIYLASSGLAPQGDFEVALPLARMSGEAELVTFTVPGWEVSQNPLNTQTDAVSATLLSASLSPVRSYVRLRLEKLPNASAESYEAALYDWQDAYLVDAHGNKLCAPIETLKNASEAGEWVEQMYVFPPAEADKVFFAPTAITPQDEWIVDMDHALPIK